MRRRYTRRRRPAYTRRRRTAAVRKKRFDPIAAGAWLGGVVGVALLLYGLVVAGHPGPAADLIAPGFALSLGVVLIIVAIALHFSTQAGWFDSKPGPRSTRRRRRTVRRNR
jgi:protein-S-isoprenylcysteine O-methyltransferase Ste14